MWNRTRVAHRCLALLIGPALLCVWGCSDDDGLGKRYPVSGTVKYNGAPVAKARVSFSPKAQGGHGAYGQVQDGSFSSVTTLNPGDGALPGEYEVSIDTREIDEEQLKAEGEKLAKKHGLAVLSQPIPELQAKSFAKAKGSIPAKYQSAATSGLTAKVEEKSNYFEFELKD